MKPDPTDDRSASPGITLLESRNHAIHGHRGRGAIIDDVVLHFEVKDGHEHHIVITHVDHMWRSCNSDDQAWQSREAHVVSKHVLYDWTTNTPIATATGERGVRIVPATPQKYGVHAFFEKPFEVYNGCEVFAFEVEVEVDGVRGKHVLPFDVEREFDADE